MVCTYSCKHSHLHCPEQKLLEKISMHLTLQPMYICIGNKNKEGHRNNYYSTPGTKMNKRRPLWTHFKSSFYLFALISDKENENILNIKKNTFDSQQKQNRRNGKMLHTNINKRWKVCGATSQKHICNIFVYVIYLRSSNSFLF